MIKEDLIQKPQPDWPGWNSSPGWYSPCNQAPLNMGLWMATLFFGQPELYYMIAKHAHLTKKKWCGWQGHLLLHWMNSWCVHGSFWISSHHIWFHAHQLSLLSLVNKSAMLYSGGILFGVVAKQWKCTWLVQWADKANQILHCDWIPEWAGWCYMCLACSGLPVCPTKSVLLRFHKSFISTKLEVNGWINWPPSFLGVSWAPTLPPSINIFK